MIPPLAPLGGVLLAIVALWLCAMPPLQHVVALDLGDAACAIEGTPGQALHTIVIHDDGHLTWNGVSLADDAELDRRLSSLRSTPRATADVLDIQLRPAAGYGRFMAVLAAAQRRGVMDVSLNGQKACTPLLID